MWATTLVTVVVAVADLLTPPAEVAPRPAPAARTVRTATRPPPPPPPAAPVGGVWARLAECESGGDWSINTGNGYSGGLQFHPQTWDAYRDADHPDDAWRATPQQQVVVAERVLAAQGWGAWPACSRKLGLR